MKLMGKFIDKVYTLLFDNFRGIISATEVKVGIPHNQV